MSRRDLFVEFSLSDGDERPQTWTEISDECPPSESESCSHPFSFFFSYSPFNGVGHGQFTARLLWDGVTNSRRHMPSGVQFFGVDIESGQLVGSPTPVIHFNLSDTIDAEEFMHSWEVTCSPCEECFYEDQSGYKRILSIAELEERELTALSNSTSKTPTLFGGERSASEELVLEETILCLINSISFDFYDDDDDYSLTKDDHDSPLPPDWDHDLNYSELINLLIQRDELKNRFPWPFRIVRLMADHPAPEVRADAPKYLRLYDPPSQEQLSLLACLANDANSAVRSAVASIRDIPPKLLEQLANDDDPVVRAKVAGSRNASVSLLERLSGDACEDVRLAVLNNANIDFSNEICRVLAGDGSEIIRAAAAQIDNIDAALLSAFAGDTSKLIRAAAARNPDISPSLSEQLAHDKCEDVRIAVSENPRTPSDVLSLLAQDESARVRAAVAEHPDLPHELVLRLSEDPASDVRGNVAERDEIPAEILARLALDDSDDVRLSIAGYNLVNLTPDIQKTLAVDSSLDVRKMVAGQDYNPVNEVLEILSRDSDEDVREALGFNSEAPASVIVRLASDSSSRVRSAIAGLEGNINTPLQVIETLAIDPVADVRRAIATNEEHASADVLIRLAQDPDVDVRRAAAGNDYRTPADVLIRLAQNPDEDVIVRFKAAMSLGIYED